MDPRVHKTFVIKPRMQKSVTATGKKRIRVSGHTFGSGLDLINTVTANEFTNFSYANELQRHVTVAVIILKMRVMDDVAF